MQKAVLKAGLLGKLTAVFVGWDDGWVEEDSVGCLEGCIVGNQGWKIGWFEGRIDGCDEGWVYNKSLSLN